MHSKGSLTVASLEIATTRVEEDYVNFGPTPARMRTGVFAAVRSHAVCSLSGLYSPSMGGLYLTYRAAHYCRCSRSLDAAVAALIADIKVANIGSYLSTKKWELFMGLDVSIYLIHQNAVAWFEKHRNADFSRGSRFYWLTYVEEKAGHRPTGSRLVPPDDKPGALEIKNGLAQVAAQRTISFGDYFADPHRNADTVDWLLKQHAELVESELLKGGIMMAKTDSLAKRVKTDDGHTVLTYFDQSALKQFADLFEDLPWGRLKQYFDYDQARADGTYKLNGPEGLPYVEKTYIGLRDLVLRGAATEDCVMVHWIE